MDFQSLAVVALSSADFAWNVNIGKEVHLDLDQTVSRTGLTATSFYIEGKPTGIISTEFRIIGIGKKIPNIIKQSGISRRI